MTQPKIDQRLIWDYYKPRQTHSWNMVCLALNTLEQLDPAEGLRFEAEYCWENLIIRLWLHRTTVRTLTKIDRIAASARDAVKRFDAQFAMNGRNGLKALRDMIEHFDDYAAGNGRGPGQRETDLDPWRSFTKDYYERGGFRLERVKSFDAIVALQRDAKMASDDLIGWLNSP